MLAWPESQLFLTAEEISSLREACAPEFTRRCRSMRIDEDLSGYLDALYLPLAAWLVKQGERRGACLVVGLCGGQGAGKSTLATLLKSVLEAGFGKRVATMSIDDIYKTKEEREALAAHVHPLFATRGVPFTHDVSLGVGVIKRLCSGALEVPIPVFDKATDTRKPASAWACQSGPCDLVLFEGWCVGAVAQPEEALLKPVNILESKEDETGVWRRTVNQALAQDYARLFGLLDTLILLRVEGMHRVFEWRRLQEQKLAREVAAAGEVVPGLSVMSGPAVERFVMHYERLTRHILAEMPARADVVMAIDSSHNPSEIHFNQPL